MMLLSLFLGALAIRGQESDIDNNTAGHKEGTAKIKLCELLACPLKILKTSQEGEPKGEIWVTPDLDIDVNWEANYFSCRITSMKINGVMKQPLCSPHEVTLEERVINDGDGPDENGLGAKDGLWNIAFHKFSETYCWQQYRVIMERKNLHSCEKFRASFSIQGEEKDGIPSDYHLYYERQDIFNFTFGPWFANTFPEIANGFDEWGGKNNGGKRSLVDSVIANKVNVMVGVAGVGLVVAVAAFTYKKKNEYAAIEQEPLNC